MPRKVFPVPPLPEGRFKKEIDWDKVDQMLIANARQTEIAAELDISIDTLADRCKLEKGSSYSEYAQKKREKGNLHFRLVQYDEAIKKRKPQVLMHCFKHRLGEWDKKEESDESPKQTEIDNDHILMSTKALLAEALERIRTLESNDSNKS